LRASPASGKDADWALPKNDKTKKIVNRGRREKNQKINKVDRREVKREEIELDPLQKQVARGGGWGCVGGGWGFFGMVFGGGGFL